MLDWLISFCNSKVCIIGDAWNCKMCALFVVCLPLADIARSTSKPVKVLEVMLTWIKILPKCFFYMHVNE